MQKKSQKFVHDGFSWNKRGSIDTKAKEFVLAVYGGDPSETYRKLREQAGGEPDWEDLAFAAACGHELARKALREKKDVG